jgi:dipeptidyl aminopeptidase/acylaminoacyl peptidase
MRKVLLSAIIALSLGGCTSVTVQEGKKSLDAKFFSVKTADGSQVRSLYTPALIPTNKLMIYLHGGPHTNFLKDNIGKQMFIDRGFDLLSIDYHGSTGYGDAFENSIKGDLGKREIDDLFQVVDQVVKKDPQFSAITQIYLSGFSYGGYLALLAATDPRAPFVKVVAMAAPSDLKTCLEEMKKCKSPGCKEARKEMEIDVFGRGTSAAYTDKRSPLRSVADLKMPVILVQGDQDAFVTPSETEAFATTARQAGRDVQVLLLLNKGHNLIFGSDSSWFAAKLSLEPVFTFLK